MIDNAAVDDISHRERAHRVRYQRDSEPGAHQANRRQKVATRVNVLWPKPHCRHEVIGIVRISDSSKPSKLKRSNGQRLDL